MIYLLFSFLFTMSVWSQDQDGSVSMLEKYKRFEDLIREVRPVETKEEKEAAYREMQKKRVQEYFDKLQASLSYGPPAEETISMSKTKSDLKDCITSKIQSGVNAKTISSLASHCKTMWKELTAEHIDYLKNKGVQLPDDFISSLQEDLKRKEEELKSYKQEEAVIEVTALMKLDEISTQDKVQLQTFDPTINTLLIDVKEIMVKMHNSQKLSTLIAEVESKGDLDGRNELLLFAEFLQKVDNPKEVCWFDGSMSTITEKPSEFFSGITGKKDGFSQSAQIVLGVPDLKGAKGVKSYKYVVDGMTNYLFEAETEIPGEKRWVMAQISEQGELSFRSFKIQIDQNSAAKIHEHKDISIFKTNLQKSSSNYPTGKFYFQAQEGLIIKADEFDAPIVGTVKIPDAKLVIGKVHLAYLSEKTLAQTNVELNHDAVRMSTKVQPTKNSNWSVQAGVKFSPIKGHLQVGTNLRAYNFIVGYSVNQSGDSQARLSYILNKNFISVDTNLKKIPNITIGHQFKKEKGNVSASRDLNGFHEVQLILFLNK